MHGVLCRWVNRRGGRTLGCHDMAGCRRALHHLRLAPVRSALSSLVLAMIVFAAGAMPAEKLLFGADQFLAR